MYFSNTLKDISKILWRTEYICDCYLKFEKESQVWRCFWSF